MYAGDLGWEPIGGQSQWKDGVRAVHPRLLVLKLGEGQEIHLDMFATKGLGKSHAKWSPVSTVFYRLLPLLTLPPAQGSPQKIVESCPQKVF